MSSPDALRAAVRNVADFPKPGIVFKDITPILAHGLLFREAITRFCDFTAGLTIDKIVGIDARGFIFAAAVADRLGLGFVPVRKKGKLPGKTRSQAYALEYGEAIIELHEDAVSPGERVMLVDDLLATGGTARAALDLLSGLGAEIVSVAFLIELSSLNGRLHLAPHTVHSILHFA
jgi:adenine phosphoribosyltransferase